MIYVRQSSANEIFFDENLSEVDNMIISFENICSFQAQAPSEIINENTKIEQHFKVKSNQ